MSEAEHFTVLEQHLLNDFQRDFPLVSRPFAALAHRLQVSEEEVIDSLRALQARGAISRVGAVLQPHRVGASTLAAMAVPEAQLEAVASLVSSYAQVNHNYAREHDYNLWFVVTAKNEAEVATVLHDIAARSGLPVLPLPLLNAYHIDLGFALQWQPETQHGIASPSPR